MMRGTVFGNAGLFSFSDPITSLLSDPEPEKTKRGPRTIPDNFLLGNRNAWTELLEQSWLKIGWSLLRIRDKRASTVEDVRKAMEPVKGIPHNSGLAAPFYRETLERAKPSAVIKIRIHVGDLDAEITKIQAKRDEAFRSCLSADAAMRTTGPEDKDIVQEEALNRLQLMLQLADDFSNLTMRREAMRKRWLDQEAYIFQSELLDFLLSRKRYAINPRNLADALAGLPGMKWRQSFARCAHMQFNTPSQEYQVLEVISEISKRLSPEAEEPIKFFRADLLKRSRTPDYTRQFLRDRWRDLRLAIEECWRLKPDDPGAGAFPFVLCSIFMRNATRQKDAKDQLLSDTEKLV